MVNMSLLHVLNSQFRIVLRNSCIT